MRGALVNMLSEDFWYSLPGEAVYTPEFAVSVMTQQLYFTFRDWGTSL